MTLEGLARKLNWNKGRLSKYENDRLGMSLSVLDKIAKALGEWTEVLVLLCLKQQYPKLSRPDSEAGQLLDALVDKLGEGRA